MQTNLRAVLDAAMQLPEAERLALVSHLMQTLPPEDNGVSIDDPELIADLDRRFADGDEGIPWSQLKAEG